MLQTSSQSLAAVRSEAGPRPARVERPTDAHLVERACGGSREAMAELHARYARMVHAILLARVAARDADDLVQDVFVQAISRLHTLRDRARFGAWLGRITRNAATDHHRKRRIVAPVEDEDAPQSADASRRLAAKQALAAIMKLSEAYREVLIMRLVEGMTGPEIAERTGLSPGSVRVNLHRGMKLLRAELQPPEDRA